jgi:hypothetical protein
MSLLALSGHDRVLTRLGGRPITDAFGVLKQKIQSLFLNSECRAL